MEALQKDFLEYIGLTSAQVLDENGACLLELPKGLDISHGTKFIFSHIFPAGSG
jgi:hypothetical protein